MKKDTLPTKLPNGEAVREFYLSLSIIQEYYWEKGYRKKAYLYRTLKEKLGWKISLESFKYHFRKAFNETSTLKQLSTVPSLDNRPKEENKEPIVSRPSFSKAKAFNPHSTSISSERIIQ